MRYSKILIPLLAISLLEIVVAENKASKQNAIVVDSAEVTDSNTIAETTVNTTSEDVTTQIPENATVIHDKNDVHLEVEVVKRNNTVSKKKTPKKTIRVVEDDPNYETGRFGGYYFIGNQPTKNYFFHGKYQKPSINYYRNYNHKLEDKSTLGHYLGYAMARMDHNEYFQHHHFTTFKVHHYFFKNSTMLPEQYVSSDNLLRCAQNTSMFCPENTEAVCLQNTTVWCASKITSVAPCEGNDSADCVTTRLPCVKSDDPNCNLSVEVVKMPCIAKIKILDPFEDKNGLTLISVAGTFILAPVLPISDRTYCITIVAEPSKD